MIGDGDLDDGYMDERRVYSSRVVDDRDPAMVSGV